MTRLSLLIASTLLTFNASALELAKYPKTFVADKGISVVIAPSSDEKQALVQISGINHPLDEVVLLTDVKPRSQDESDYATTLDGSAYVLIGQRQDWGRVLPAIPAEQPRPAVPELRRESQQGSQASRAAGPL
ncbi:hypothetical protein [Pseudomonas sp. OHS18]|uniref:hypothetical protein n=1 Tax=Pseudomonas sp. OHS18 TaxID=3399679 RepID=UPI003A8464EF